MTSDVNWRHIVSVCIVLANYLALSMTNAREKGLLVDHFGNMKRKWRRFGNMSFGRHYVISDTKSTES